MFLVTVLNFLRRGIIKEDRGIFDKMAGCEHGKDNLFT
jgi:hypothetical protein